MQLKIEFEKIFSNNELIFKIFIEYISNESNKQI